MQNYSPAMFSSVFYTLKLERNIKFWENTHWETQESSCDILYHVKTQTYTCDKVTLNCTHDCGEPIQSMQVVTADEVGICVSSIMICRVCFSFTNYKLGVTLKKFLNIKINDKWKSFLKINCFAIRKLPFLSDSKVTWVEIIRTVNARCCSCDSELLALLVHTAMCGERIHLSY